MLTIKKGNITTKVSRQSYEKIFKRKGYKVIGDDVPKTEAAQKNEQEPETEASTATEQSVNVDEIPVSEMTKEQLAEFATKHGIDTSAARNVREARQAVQKWIRDNKVKTQ